MNIGELNHRVSFERNEKTSDGQGGFVADWTVIASVWAKVNEQSQVGVSSVRERFNRGNDSHTQSFTFLIRQPQAFIVDNTRNSDNLRISHRGQYFRITGISQYKYKLDFYEIKAELWGAIAQ